MSKGKTLKGNVFIDGTLYAAGSTPPKEIAEQIDNPKAWGDDDTSSEASGESAGSELPDTVEELEALVEERNATREEGERMTVEGTGANGRVLKKDLVAALKADDAASA